MAQKSKEWRRAYYLKNKEKIKENGLRSRLKHHNERKKKGWGHYSQGKKCKFCAKPLVNASKIGMCLRCFNSKFPRGASLYRKGTTSSEHARKISMSLCGRKWSEEMRKKLTGPRVDRQDFKCTMCGKVIKVERSYIKKKKFCSLDCSHVYHRGENAQGWKGGVTKPNESARKGKKFKDWREAVFKRDNWTCQECGVRGGKLHPHHIKSFAKFQDLRYEVSNGVTLCVGCHRKKHKKSFVVSVQRLREIKALHS